MAATASFDTALFRFLRELAKHNDRAWFEANKARYVEHVEGPMLAFIEALGPRLKKVAPEHVADPRKVGGSLFRIHRDTRFSKDKSPYKTWTAAYFAHKAKKRAPSVPGFYLHLEPGNNVAGGGIYHPEAASLLAIRTRIVERPKEWAAATRGGLVLEGEKLKRVPRGFDPEHPAAEALKHKDLYTSVRFSDAEVTAPGFLDRYVDACRTAAPLVRFISTSLDLDG